MAKRVKKATKAKAKAKKKSAPRRKTTKKARSITLPFTPGKGLLTAEMLADYIKRGGSITQCPTKHEACPASLQYNKKGVTAFGRGRGSVKVNTLMTQPVNGTISANTAPDIPMQSSAIAVGKPKFDNKGRTVIRAFRKGNKAA